MEGVGIGWRPELAAGLLAEPARVDLVEIVAERCMADRAAAREAQALRELWPIAVHGVNLSLGSADGIVAGASARLGRIARLLRASFVSEHVALTRVRSCEIGHLTAVPFHPDTVRIVARNVSTARRHLPDVPFLLENIAWTLRWREDAMPEGAFYAAVARETGCGLLLDVANLYANARNSGVEPLRALSEFPLEHVEMIHVAGGEAKGGFYFDTHAHALSEPLLTLLAAARRARPHVPVVLERDRRFPSFAETAAEIEQLRAACRSPSVELPSTQASHAGANRAAVPDMAARQRTLARALTTPHVVEGFEFDVAGLARTRAVLQEKRLDHALPLLPTLGRLGIEELARAHLARWPRPPEHVAASDALRLAAVASREPTLALAARRDELALRARFIGPDASGAVRPRVGPFVGRARLGRTTLWAVKAPGRTAMVRLFEGVGSRP